MGSSLWTVCKEVKPMVHAKLFMAPWHAPSVAFSEAVTLVIPPDRLTLLNIDEFRELAKSLGVSRIPRLLVYDDERLIWSGVGVCSPRVLSDVLSMLKKRGDHSILKEKAGLTA